MSTSAVVMMPCRTGPCSSRHAALSAAGNSALSIPALDMDFLHTKGVWTQSWPSAHRLAAREKTHTLTKK